MGKYVELLFRSINKHGLLETLRLVPKNFAHFFRLLYDDFFDRRFGTDTSGVIELKDLDIDSENVQYGVWYEPTSSHIFSYILGKLPSIFSLRYEDYVYIDFGSGKGRTLLLASDFPFAEIIGIEFSRELCSIAQNNIEIYRKIGQKCNKIKSKCVDAGSYRLTRKYSVIFLYNLFGKPILQKVIDSIKTALNEMQGRVVIIYYNPIHAKVFDECGFLGNKIILDLPFDLSKSRQSECYIYTNLFINNIT